MLSNWSARKGDSMESQHTRATAAGGMETMHGEMPLLHPIGDDGAQGQRDIDSKAAGSRARRALTCSKAAKGSAIDRAWKPRRSQSAQGLEDGRAPEEQLTKRRAPFLREWIDKMYNAMHSHAFNIIWNRCEAISSGHGLEQK